MVPWREEGDPRFVADVMCEGLARQLRMVGVDTLCALAPPKHNRHHVHRCDCCPGSTCGWQIGLGHGALHVGHAFSQASWTDVTWLKFCSALHCSRTSPNINAVSRPSRSCCPNSCEGASRPACEEAGSVAGYCGRTAWHTCHASHELMPHDAPPTSAAQL